MIDIPLAVLSASRRAQEHGDVGDGQSGASGVACEAVIAPAVFEMLVANVLVAETLDAVDGVDDQRLESVVLALQVADGFQNLLPVLGRLGEVGDGVGKPATGP